MDLSLLPKHAGQWLRTHGPAADVVISSRVRLARNLVGHPFPNRANAAERKAVRERLEQIIGDVRRAKGDIQVHLSEEPAQTRQLLKERHLISREHAEGDGEGRGLVFTRSEVISIMLNEEDHLRIQAIRPGLQIDRTLHVVNLIDDLFSRRVDFAFSERYGYLTACPTNTGTAMRAGVMVHLPALFITRHVEKVVQAAQKMGMALRGFYGEGSAPHGHFFQISNQVSLGKSEAELIEDLKRLLIKVIEYERKMRDVLVKESAKKIEDRIWRSLGILTTARMIGSDEAMGHLSDVRLGISLGLVKGLSLETLNEMFVLIQPAHLQHSVGSELSQETRDEKRAEFLRQRLTDIARN